jgi:hypothetical protein
VVQNGEVDLVDLGEVPPSEEEQPFPEASNPGTNEHVTAWKRSGDRQLEDALKTRFFVGRLNVLPI